MDFPKSLKIISQKTIKNIRGTKNISGTIMHNKTISMKIPIFLNFKLYANIHKKFLIKKPDFFEPGFINLKTL
jgi:hypothetical protein